MESPLFHPSNLEIADGRRFGLQNDQMLRVSPGLDVLGVKGAMVALTARSGSTTRGPAALGDC